MGFSRAGIGVFVIAALGFLGVGIGVFVVAALGFLSVGIGVFSLQALVFSWPRHWCFCALAPLFFRGRKSASRAENPKNADAWTRWTSKRVQVSDFTEIHARMPIGGGAAVRRIQADQSHAVRGARRGRVARARGRPRAGRADGTGVNELNGDGTWSSPEQRCACCVVQMVTRIRRQGCRQHHRH